MKTRSFVFRAAAIISIGLATLQAFASQTAPATRSRQTSKPHRMIVLTDIEADPDDTESMVRLLLYSDVIDIQGLVATTSIHQQSAVHPESLQAIIRAYAKAQPNLLKHDANYPGAEALQALIKQGRAEYGMSGVGAGKDSEGSEWIIRALEKKDDRPLWVTVWGGPNTLAQALYKLRATRPAAEVERLVAKLRVYTICDQDDSGPWMRKNFPGLFYIVTPGGNYGGSIWSGVHSTIPGIDNSTVSNKWLAENIQQGHGPLGAAYPDVAYGMEGDTPSWLNLIPNGLSVPEHPDWGGWGGRYELYQPTGPLKLITGTPIESETRPLWADAIDEYTPPVTGEYGRATKIGEKSFKDNKVTLWRWRDDFQNDFAARMCWATKSFQECNHPPVPILKHADALTVKSGHRFELNARGTTDSDGDSLSYYWFQYPEAGSYKGAVKVRDSENLDIAYAIAPKVEKPETIHFILRVTDKGTPHLSRYKRVIVTVTP